MGRLFLIELDGRVYKCKFCRSHLALADDLVSRSFSCRRGKAYLFNTAVNVIVGTQVERMMLSGLHTVADIFCCSCGQIVGWKYQARADNNQYSAIFSHVPHSSRCYRVLCTEVMKKEAAHDKSQKYKEGKFVLERGRIVDGVDAEFYLDTRSGTSDAEDA